MRTYIRVHARCFWRFVGRLLIAGWVLIHASGVLAAGSVAAVENATSIVVPKTGGEVINFAAQELASYLKQITGKVVPVNNLPEGHHIYLGEIPPSVNSGIGAKAREDLQKLQEDGFIIRSAGPDMIILGKGSRGDLYGCYAFLERLGVRWYFPGKRYEVVPHRRLDWTTPVDISESPGIPKRILFYWPNNYSSVQDWIDFSAKMRLNRIAFHYTWPAIDWYINLRSVLLPELRRRGMEIEAGGHLLSAFMPRTLFTRHPDWFRMNKKGQRVNDYNLNPFNQDALNYLAEGAMKYLPQMPEARLFHLWADDIEGGGWSHEPGKGDYTPSDQSLMVSNYLIQRLRQKLPTADLAFLAYHDTVYPPKVVKPDPGIIYFYAPRERCYAHALNDSRCPLNQIYSKALEQGLRSFGASNSEVFEYYVDEILFENMANPPLPEVLSADAQYYQRLGIPAVGALMTNTSSFTTPMVNMFLYPQALWDPHRNLKASLDEYAKLYFGDPMMSRYFDQLDRGLADTLKICEYQHPGSAWDSVTVAQEPDDALAYHVRGIEGGLRGPLSGAESVLQAVLRHSTNPVDRERLESEQVSLSFTLQQARLYYHLLKGELLYRIWKSHNDPEAGLGTLTEAILAQRTWNNLKTFAGTSGMKGNPLMPNPQALRQRVHDLEALVTTNPAKAVGANIAGYEAGDLAEHLMNGVSGYILGGPTGSRAVVWTDERSSRKAIHPRKKGLKWENEFGQPLKPGRIDLYSEPVLVGATGMSVDKLFDALAQSQPLP